MCCPCWTIQPDSIGNRFWCIWSVVSLLKHYMTKTSLKQIGQSIYACMRCFMSDSFKPVSYFADGRPVPDLMTEQELIEFLRIPEVSKAKDFHNVVKNLIRFNALPRIQICKRLLFPQKAVVEWIDKNTTRN